MGLIDLLAAIAVLLQVADYATTVRGIRSGLAREANPVMRFAMRIMPPVTAVAVVKLLLLAAIYAMWSGGFAAALFVADIVYLYVVWSNMRFLR